jgi:hypothetical protein
MSPRPAKVTAPLNLVVHEASHSIDLNGGGPSPSQSDDFTRAREADMNKLSDYERKARIKTLHT